MRSSTITLILLSVLFASGTVHSGDGVPAPDVKAAKDDAQTPSAAAAASPRAVVARWLEMHRTGDRDEASALTTGSHYHRAVYLLSSKRDTGVRVDRSLGNQRAAAVVTSSLEDARDGKRVLLFWLVRRDGAWRINKSETADRCVVDERLRGFLEAGDVRWHVQRGQLLGHWVAGPGTPPGGSGVACGSRLQLSDDNRYRLVAWGPGGPDPESDDVMQGVWRFAGGQILLSHQDRTHKCRVAWMADNLLVVESLSGKGRARYKRTDAAHGGDVGGARKERQRFDKPLAVPAADKPGDALAALERKLHGTWNGDGPCDGQLILKSDGTYERKLYGPSGSNSDGSWTLRWNALPPTLTLDCKKSDNPDYVGRAVPWKLFQLDDATLAIKYESTQEQSFSRAKR